MIVEAMRAASKEDAMLLYAPHADPYFEELIKNADKCFTSQNEDMCEKIDMILKGQESEDIS